MACLLIVELETSGFINIFSDVEHLEFVGLGKEGGVDRHVIVGVEVGAAKSVGHRFLLGGNET